MFVVTFADVTEVVVNSQERTRVLCSWHDPKLRAAFTFTLADVTFEQFEQFVRCEFGEAGHSYAVRSFAEWAHRTHITADNLGAILRSMIKIMVYKETGSPEKAPEEDDVSALTAASGRSSKSGDSGRGSLQTEFSLTVRYIDKEVCLICGVAGADRSQCLQAAHVIDVSTSNVREVCVANGLAGPYDPRNGLTMCVDCHRAFDNHFCCVSPDLRVMVADALVETPKFKDKWSPLVGKKIERVEAHRPPAATLQYRVAVYTAAVLRRQAFASSHPFACELCGQRVKSARGLSMHHQSSTKCGPSVGGHRYAGVHTPAATPVHAARECTAPDANLGERFRGLHVGSTPLSTPARKPSFKKKAK